MRWRILGWGAGVAGAALFLLLLWKGPWWADGAHLGPTLTPGTGAVVTGFRTAVVAVGAGVVAAIGLFYTDRNFRHTREKDREQAELTREGQMTDRYATAISLLAGPEPTKRIGGIFALERIMRDSPKDHDSVVEVLAAFVREHAPAPPEGTVPAGRTYRAPEHINTAMVVLGRRPIREEPYRIDLRRTDLRGVYLKEARLRRARLGGACLFHADLRGADLQDSWCPRARFDGAHMRGASLAGANLDRARLTNADLRDARLSGVRLRDSDLSTTNLTSADLSGADLSTSKLSLEQLLATRAFANARLPQSLAEDPQVQARMQ